MPFIGIIADSKSFENVKSTILKNINQTKLNIININLQSIENIKNIKFETIVIDCNLDKFKEKEEILKKICSNSKYLILNTDMEIRLDILENQKFKIITYGLNQKATVTISSITETDLLIDLQRNIENIKKKVIEAEEIRIKLSGKTNFKVYEILIIYIIFSIYDVKIMDVI